MAEVFRSEFAPILLVCAGPLLAAIFLRLERRALRWIAGGFTYLLIAAVAVVFLYPHQHHIVWAAERGFRFQWGVDAIVGATWISGMLLLMNGKKRRKSTKNGDR